MRKRRDLVYDLRYRNSMPEVETMLKTDLVGKTFLSTKDESDA